MRYLSMSLLSWTILCLPLSSIHLLDRSDREYLKEFFQKVLNVPNAFLSKNIFNLPSHLNIYLLSQHYAYLLKLSSIPPGL